MAKVYRTAGERADAKAAETFVGSLVRGKKEIAVREIDKQALSLLRPLGKDLFDIIKDMIMELGSIYVIVANGTEEKVDFGLNPHNFDTAEVRNMAGRGCAEKPVLVLSRLMPEELANSECRWYMTVYCGNREFGSYTFMPCRFEYKMKSFVFSDFPIRKNVSEPDADKVISKWDVYSLLDESDCYQNVRRNSMSTQRSCPIYIKYSQQQDKAKIKKTFDEIEQQARDIIKAHAKDRDPKDIGQAMETIIPHIRRLSNSDFVLSTKAHDILGRLGIPDLTDLVGRAERIARDIMPRLGAFFPRFNGKAHIELYYDKIKETYEKYKTTILTGENDFAELFRYVLAHEMMHAFHFAAVMSTSGDWSGEKTDFFTCMAVKETIAEYFAMTSSYYTIQQYVNTIRSSVSFPNDGGYSGALLIKNKSHFDEVYRTSLNDMRAAFDLIV